MEGNEVKKETIPPPNPPNNILTHIETLASVKRAVIGIYLTEDAGCFIILKPETGRERRPIFTVEMEFNLFAPYPSRSNKSSGRGICGTRIGCWESGVEWSGGEVK